MKKAFTLIELVVAIAILAMVSGFAGVVFRVSVDSHRTALANAEIMRNLRAITSQLDADFKGLRKDGEIFVVWTAVPVDDIDSPYLYDDDYDGDGFIRFDRIMFFTTGDFQSYGVPAVRGNIARISYMLANTPVVEAHDQPPQDRILARTQHILTADPDPDLVGFRSLLTLDKDELDIWHNRYEYDRISLQEWKNMPIPDKLIAMSVISGVDVLLSSIGMEIGALFEPRDPNLIHIHNLLCQGVGEFKVQGWYAPLQRWVPEVNPDPDEDLTDGDFFVDGTGLDPLGRVPVLFYHPRLGFVFLGGELAANSTIYYQDRLNEERFDDIPGLGRALKFTFTLYDSRGIIENGRTFTHIVYLGD